MAELTLFIQYLFLYIYRRCSWWDWGIYNLFFIAAERAANWTSHVLCAQQKIPFFHASGHFHYAKCTHLYVQDMLSLRTRHPDIAKQFADKGFFTVNNSGSSWAGIWSDMAIEQTVMRSMKSDGGLTRGRGISDSVLAKWIGGASAGAAICSAVEEFSGSQFRSGEQHIDFRQSRRLRDDQDREKTGSVVRRASSFSRLR